MTDNDAANSKQIEALIVSWAEAVRARDLEKIVANRSDDILMFDVPPPTQLRGTQAYKESWLPFFKWLGESGTFELSDITVHAGETVAFATALVRCTGNETNGNEIEPRVRLTLGLRKLAGSWKVVHEHHSMPAT